MILDGWGFSTECAGNAIFQAHPVHFNRLQKQYPYTLLKCSGTEVGLPPGQMGNSEVGHLNIGAGRIVYQEISRITRAIEDGEFFQNPCFLEAIKRAQSNQGAVHLMGLLSDGGVHSHINHLWALLELCHRQQVKVFVHCFLDGRDVPPQSALTYIRALQDKMEALGTGKIATVMGRYFAMDRDHRWERIEKAYRALVQGQGIKTADAVAGVMESYAGSVSDEFIEPMVMVDGAGKPLGTIGSKDSIIFYNFRADRARQISQVFLDHNFNVFERQLRPDVYFVGMTQYDINLASHTAFEPQALNNTLGEVLAAAGKKQLRIAETEKYAHVTFFFNGGVEEPSPNEDRILVPSPQVKTYDLQPEMSAPEVTRQVLEALDRDYYDMIIMNYANADMVGHTGMLEAAVKAVTAVDQEMIRVVEKVKAKGGLIIITSDHGNCEKMLDPETGKPHTAHTDEKVPFILVSYKEQGKPLREGGALQDIAPTLLSLMKIAIPSEMTGKSLLEHI